VRLREKIKAQKTKPFFTHCEGRRLSMRAARADGLVRALASTGLDVAVAIREVLDRLLSVS
jgi:hypothetical protein